MSVPALLVTLALLPTAAPDEPVDVAFFENRVRPVLVEHCGACHGAEQQKSGLRLDRPAGILAGGERGTILVPGDPDASLLVTAVRWDDFLLEMPPKTRLPDDIIADLERWVAGGAPMPEVGDNESHAATSPGDFDLAARAAHWSLQPVADPPPPKVSTPDWAGDPLDLYVLARLEAARLAPAPPADRATLLRRLSYDLNGLPPTPEQLAAFEADERADAVERVVDTLLASPRFGETWGRHWLDLVRYADTRGHEFDFPIPNAWQYRDYVVRALNADVPYDRFVREHVAGDLLPEARRHYDGWDESPLGTGFWFLGEGVHSPVDIRQDQVDRLANQIDVFGRAFLGLTVACARCHDHKFDAITAEDYYALNGYLLSSTYRQLRFETVEHNARLAERLWKEQRRRSQRLAPAIAAQVREQLDGFPQLLQRAHTVLESGPLPAEAAAWQAFIEASPDHPAVAELSPPPAPEPDPAAPAEPPADPPERARWMGLHRRAVTLAEGPPDLLRRLVDDLDGAADDWTHPLAPLSRPLRGEDFLSPLEPDQPPNPRTRLEARVAATQRILSGAQTLWRADAGGPFSSDHEHFDRQDSSIFPRAIVAGGTLIVPTVPARGRTRLVPHDALVEDTVWRDLALAPGTEHDPGSHDWVSAGRSFRTPSVVLERPRLLVLVRGGGRAATVVNGHRLVAGPLHKAVLSRWDDDGGRLQWVEQDLTDYLGQRVHVELSPAGNGQALEVLMVVAADERPPLTAPSTWSWLHGWPTYFDYALTVAYGQIVESTLLRSAVDRLERGTLSRDDPDLPVPAAQLIATLDWFLWLYQDRIELPPLDPVEDAELMAMLEARRLTSATAPTLVDMNGADEQLLVRGSHRSPAGAVPRRFLEVLGGKDGRAGTPWGSGRLDLARRLTDPSNPLLTRVAVNRVWHHLFGRGLVASVDDFGVMGEAPSHPELLDHLATRFMAGGWSLKTLIRDIVLSSTYRQSVTGDPAGRERDPQNRLLHRASVRRLTGEALRDGLLAVSGRLTEVRGGPAVPIHLTAFLEGRGRPPHSGPLDGAGRRSLYLSVRRNFPDPFLTVFDRPTPFSTMGRRGRSNVPAQALALMNDPFVVDLARSWARAELDTPRDDATRIDGMLRRAFGRAPAAGEVERLLSWLDGRRVEAWRATQAARLRGSPDGTTDGTVVANDDAAPATDAQPAGLVDTELDAWADLAHVLFNVKDFAFLD